MVLTKGSTIVKAGDGGARSDSEVDFERYIINGNQPLDRSHVAHYALETAQIDRISPAFNLRRWEASRVATVSMRHALPMHYASSHGLVIDRKLPYLPNGYYSIYINPDYWNKFPQLDQRNLIWAIVLVEHFEAEGSQYSRHSVIPPSKTSSAISYSLPESEQKRFTDPEQVLLVVQGNAAKLTLDFLRSHEAVVVERLGQGGYEWLITAMNYIIDNNQ